MNDLRKIRAIPSYGKKEAWPTWSENHLAKARRFGINDVLSGKVKIPRTGEN
jgi:hypothetical protein